MKNKIFLSLFLTCFLALPFLVKADDLAIKLKGRILLQVEANGEAWYVNPADNEKYYLGRPADAFRLMRTLGLGVSNADFSKFNGTAPARLAGRILLKVEANGEAYYVNPIDLKMHYLGRPADAFQLMRGLGLGISNANLEKVITKSGYGRQVKPEDIPNAETEKDKVIPDEENNQTGTSTATTTPIEEESTVATSTEETVVSTAATCEFQAEYFKNINLTGWPVVSRTEIGINNNWWTGKPEGFSYNNEFSVRWIGSCNFSAGNHKFTATFNDAMRVHVDNKLIIDSWQKVSDDVVREADLDLTVGKHEVRVEYFENTLAASAKLDWKKN